MVPLIINLVTGAIGGNAAGKIFKNLDLGTIGNSLSGIVGGGLGGFVLQQLGIAASPSGELDLSAIIGSVASGGVGGGAVMAIIGAIKKAMGK